MTIMPLFRRLAFSNVLVICCSAASCRGFVYFIGAGHQTLSHGGRDHTGTFGHISGSGHHDSPSETIVPSISTTILPAGYFGIASGTGIFLFSNTATSALVGSRKVPSQQ